MYKNKCGYKGKTRERNFIEIISDHIEKKTNEMDNTSNTITNTRQFKMVCEVKTPKGGKIAKVKVEQCRRNIKRERENVERKQRYCER